MPDQDDQRTVRAPGVPGQPSGARAAARVSVGGVPGPRVGGSPGTGRGGISGGGPAAGPQPSAAPRPGTGRRPPQLSAGGQLAPANALDQLVLPGGQAGLLIGRDAHGEPVAIRPFQRHGVRLALIGGLWSARLLVFRSLALGARVVVHTERPAEWHGMGRWAVGRDDRLTVLDDVTPVLVAATPSMPTLTVQDFGAHSVLSPQNVGPWRTELSVLSQVGAAGFLAIEQAHLLISQRLTPSEAFAAQSVRRFGDQTLDTLQRLADDMLALVGGDAGTGSTDGYLWTTPTRWELEAFGQPHR